MEIRQIDQSDETLVHRHWEIGRDADAASRPYDFYPHWETAWLTYQGGRSDVKFVLLGAFDEDRMVGAARTDVNLLDNLHSAMSSIFVDPQHQRRGVGRALDAACVEVAREHGRRLLITEAYAPMDGESPGLLFARAMGYAMGLVDGMKVVDLIETEPHLGRPRGEGGAPPRRLPGRHLARQRPCGVRRRLLRAQRGVLRGGADGGHGDRAGEVGQEAGRATREHRNALSGRHDVSAGAVSPGRAAGGADRGDGQRARTVARVPERDAGRPGSTAGHHLGLAIKLANHRQVREAWPELRMLLTGNADVNAPMNAVNDALGYREVERCVEMQKDI